MKQVLKTKDDVQQSFLQLLAEYKRNKSQILTKEELAMVEQHKKLVTEVATFTPENIVKGLADLQLELGVSVEALANRLQTELKKLEDLRSAIAVQNGYLQETLSAKEAANALHILKQEQAQREQTLEEERTKALEKMDTEIAERRKVWEKQQTDFEEREAEYKVQLEKTRQKEAEDFTYSLARKYQLEQDEYETRKKLLLRDLEEKEKAKAKNWEEREAILAKNQADLEKYVQKVDNFEAEVAEKTKEAREKIIKNTSKECKESMELLEREVAGKQKVAELQAQNLDATVAQNKLEIEKLSGELKETLSQVQQLSLKALDVNRKN